MLELIEKTTEKIRVMDLKEGDFAEIEHGEEIKIIYIYRETPTSQLCAVSVTSKSDHWGRVGANTIEVIRVLKAGDVLKVVNK